MMIHYDFAHPLQSLDGSDVLDASGDVILLSSVLASVLVGARTSAPQTMLAWARQLQENGGLDIDDADLLVLRNLVLAEKLPSLIAGSLLDILDGPAQHSFAA